MEHVSLLYHVLLPLAAQQALLLGRLLAAALHQVLVCYRLRSDETPSFHFIEGSGRGGMRVRVVLDGTHQEREEKREGEKESNHHGSGFSGQTTLPFLFHNGERLPSTASQDGQTLRQD